MEEWPSLWLIPSLWREEEEEGYWVSVMGHQPIPSHERSKMGPEQNNSGFLSRSLVAVAVGIVTATFIFQSNIAVAHPCANTQED